MSDPTTLVPFQGSAFAPAPQAIAAQTPPAGPPSPGLSPEEAAAYIHEQSNPLLQPTGVPTGFGRLGTLLYNAVDGGDVANLLGLGKTKLAQNLAQVSKADPNDAMLGNLLSLAIPVGPLGDVGRLAVKGTELLPTIARSAISALPFVAGRAGLELAGGQNPGQVATRAATGELLGTGLGAAGEGLAKAAPSIFKAIHGGASSLITHGIANVRVLRNAANFGAGAGSPSAFASNLDKIVEQMPKIITENHIGSDAHKAINYFNDTTRSLWAKAAKAYDDSGSTVTALLPRVLQDPEVKAAVASLNTAKGMAGAQSPELAALLQKGNLAPESRAAILSGLSQGGPGIDEVNALAKGADVSGLRDPFRGQRAYLNKAIAGGFSEAAKTDPVLQARAAIAGKLKDAVDAQAQNVAPDINLPGMKERYAAEKALAEGAENKLLLEGRGAVAGSDTAAKVAAMMDMTGGWMANPVTLLQQLSGGMIGDLANKAVTGMANAGLRLGARGARQVVPTPEMMEAIGAGLKKGERAPPKITDLPGGGFIGEQGENPLDASTRAQRMLARFAGGSYLRNQGKNIGAGLPFVGSLGNNPPGGGQTTPEQAVAALPVGGQGATTPQGPVVSWGYQAQPNSKEAPFSSPYDQQLEQAMKTWWDSKGQYAVGAGGPQNYPDFLKWAREQYSENGHYLPSRTVNVLLRNPKDSQQTIRDYHKVQQLDSLNLDSVLSTLPGIASVQGALSRLAGTNPKGAQLEKSRDALLNMMAEQVQFGNPGTGEKTSMDIAKKFLLPMMRDTETPLAQKKQQLEQFLQGYGLDFQKLKQMGLIQ